MPSIMTRSGTEIYVKDWGVGRPLVMIHGWPLTADSWDDVAIPLANAGFRIMPTTGVASVDPVSRGTDTTTTLSRTIWRMS